MSDPSTPRSRGVITRLAHACCRTRSRLSRGRQRAYRDLRATPIAVVLLLSAACSPETNKTYPAYPAAGGRSGFGGAGAPATGGSTAASSSLVPPAAPIVPPAATASAPTTLLPGAAGASAAPPTNAGTARPTTPPTAAAPAMMMTPPAMMPPVLVKPDQKLPPVTNYEAAGPYPSYQASANTGPDGMYTLFRPTNLNANGFKFIPATWGNGITTTPQTYPWLTTVASHGFVIIASNSTMVTPEMMTKGLDWLIMQNDMPDDLQGKLDTSRAVCIGYSLGGGGAVSCASHPKVIATIAMHPAPGFGTGLHGPLLLLSGTNDTVCVPETFVQPIFNGSTVPTFYGMLDGADHLEPVLGGRETAPFIAWLRLWVFGDEGGKAFFYGPDCKLCKAPWTMPQSKMLQ